VGNGNVENLNLLLTPGIDLKGQVRVEGQGDVHLESLSVLLEVKDSIPMGRPGTRVKDDGSFAIENVAADTYTVTVNGMPDGYYTKAVRLGDADGLENPLDLTQGAGNVLEILINPNGGQVDGNVDNAGQQPAGGATVVLVPNARRQQPSLYKTASTDQYGHFSFKGIAPGDYKLFAWDEVEYRAYEDPEFMKPYENLGQGVTIRESAHETAQLKLILTEASPGGKNAAN
jgi:hypothetical protein